VSAVILEDRGLSNDKFLLSFLRNRVHVHGLPQIPEDPLDDLTDWFSESSSVFNVLKDALQSFYLNRIERLNSMQRKSKDLLWWPFTQHNLVPQFDACASWWTQGPDSNLQAVFVA